MSNLPSPPLRLSAAATLLTHLNEGAAMLLSRGVLVALSFILAGITAPAAAVDGQENRKWIEQIIDRAEKTNIVDRLHDGIHISVIIPSSSPKILYLLTRSTHNGENRCIFHFRAADHPYHTLVDSHCDGTVDFAKTTEEGQVNPVDPKAFDAFYETHLKEFTSYIGAILPADRRSNTKAVINIWGDSPAFGETLKNSPSLLHWVHFIFSNDHEYALYATSGNGKFYDWCRFVHKTPEGKNVILDEFCNNLVSRGISYDARGNKIPGRYFVPPDVYGRLANEVRMLVWLTKIFNENN